MISMVTYRHAVPIALKGGPEFEVKSAPITQTLNEFFERVGTRQTPDSCELTEDVTDSFSSEDMIGKEVSLLSEGRRRVLWGQQRLRHAHLGVLDLPDQECDRIFQAIATSTNADAASLLANY